MFMGHPFRQYQLYSSVGAGEKKTLLIWGCMHERAGVVFRAVTVAGGDHFDRDPRISFAAMHVIPVLLTVAEGSLHCPGGFRWCTRGMIDCCSGFVCNLAH